MKPRHIILIGNEVEVIEAANKNLKGINGLVTNETKNTITIKNKTIIKDQVTLKLGTHIIKGNELTRTPAERVKK